MEIVKMALCSWPLVALIIGIVALGLFRKALAQFLGRASQVGVAGVKITAKAQEQKTLEAPSQISKADELAAAFQSALITEVETNLRKQVDEFSSDSSEREKMLVKVLAAHQIALDFEKIYRAIFGSQLTMLQSLTASSSVFEDPETYRPYYEQAKSKLPDFYGSYTFENWLSFLQSQVLITQQNQKIAITVRGKEFLKYLIEHGYTFKKSG